MNAPGSVIRGLSITRFASGFAGIFIGGGFGSTVECNYIGLTPFQALGANYDGVRISGSANNVIGGDTAASRNVISGNTNVGVVINGPTPDSSAGFNLQTVVRNNFIGVDPGGTVIRGNGGNGISITNAQLNTVASNLVSGNGGEGIAIYGFRSTGNIIQGNYVGTNAPGTAAIGNTNSGIYLRRAGQNSIVGNVVSGNTGFAGIALCGTPTFCGGGEDTGLSSDASGNAIRGNIVGLTAAGTDPLRNAGYGVSLDGAPNTIIGGTAAGDPNVISSNGPAGVVIFGEGANGNLVRGNYIGTDITGTLDRHNNGPGVTIPAGSNNIISGTDAGLAPNVIMFNQGFGIHVGDASTNNKLRINRIDLNGDLGINLGTATVLPNDPGDLDAGANDGQNYPALTSAQVANGTLTLQGTLNTDASHPYTIDVYASPTCDASGNGEGRQWIGSFVPAAVNVAFSHAFQTALVTSGQAVTAVATLGIFDPQLPEASGSTSEFSNCVTVGTGGGTVTDPTGDAAASGIVAPSPDLVSTTVVNTGTALVFQVRFAAGTFDPLTSFAQVLIDTDQNAATGHPGIDSGCATDAGVVGSEFIVTAGIDGAFIGHYLGSCNAFETIDVRSVEVVAGGYNITVPLAILNDDGLVDYKVVTFVNGSGVLDVMPNVGLPPATTGGGVIIP